MKVAELLTTYRVESRVTAITPPETELLERLVEVDRHPQSSAPQSRYDSGALDEWALFFVVRALDPGRAEAWARAECERIGLDVLALRNRKMR